MVLSTFQVLLIWYLGDTGSYIVVHRFIHCCTQVHTLLYTGSYIVVHRFIHYCTQVHTLLYTGSYIIVHRFIHYCTQVHTLLYTGSYIVVHRFIHCCTQVHTLLYTGSYIVVYKDTRSPNMATGYTTYWKRCVIVEGRQVPLTVNANPTGYAARCRPFSSSVDASPTALLFPDGMSSDAVNGMNPERVTATHTHWLRHSRVPHAYIDPRTFVFPRTLCLTLGSTNI